MSGGPLREVHIEGSPGVLNIGFDKRSSVSSIMLGLVAISQGHSVTECREETSASMTIEEQLLENCPGWF